MYRDEEELRLLDVLLAARERNAGIGTSILNALQQDAVRHGVAVTLHVEAHNRARALYARAGFLEEASDGLYVQMRWVPPA